MASLRYVKADPEAGGPMGEPTLEAIVAQYPGPDARLGSILDEMANEMKGLRALVIGDASGLPVASLVRGPKTLVTTAMATLAMSAAAKVTESLALPDPDDILIEAGSWLVLVHGIGNRCTLTGVFSIEVNLRLVKMSMETHGREIRELLEDLM